MHTNRLRFNRFLPCRLPFATAFVRTKDTTEQGFEAREKCGRAAWPARMGLSPDAVDGIFVFLVA